jgi:aspartate aminotransferase
MNFTAQRLDRISSSQTIAVRQKVAAMKREGRDVLGVSAGEPDFDTPQHVKDAAIRAIDAGETKYTDVAGTPALRRAVADRFRSDCGIDYRADEIIIGTGAKQVLFNAMLATLNDGDEAIIPTPCWVSYPDIVAVAGGRPVFVPCSHNHAFRLRGEDLEAAITPRTRWFILNNPCNPTGVAYSAADLRPLCDVLLRHPDVWVMTDDIYAKLSFEEKPATIVQVEPRLKDRTVTLSGCSKSYAMTGWRIGFAGAPAPLVKAMDKLQSQSTSNPSSISQAAAHAALTGPEDFITGMVGVFRTRRDMLVEMLNAAPGITCRKPEATFYVFPSIAGCLGRTTRRGVRITDDLAFVTALLDEEGVAAVHGTVFMCPDHFRMSYAADTEMLREACRRIQRFCHNLSR